MAGLQQAPGVSIPPGQAVANLGHVRAYSRVRHVARPSIHPSEKVRPVRLTFASFSIVAVSNNRLGRSLGQGQLLAGLKPGPDRSPSS